MLINSKKSENNMAFKDKLRRHVRTTIHLKEHSWFTRLLKTFENRRKKFVAFLSRPQFSAEYGLYPDAVKKQPKTAVVIQGPLVSEKDFTLETVKIYKQIFPQSEIIVSVWGSENAELVSKIKKCGVTIVQTTPPEYSGQQHINFQIAGSVAGIKKAQELGAEYVFKTRSDQRIYEANALEFCLNLIKTFPITHAKQNKRIVGVSLDTFKYRLYAVSDMCMFGHIDDMLLYWGPKLDDRPKITSEPKTMKEFANVRICETYLTTEFLKSIGETLDWTLQDSWRKYADHFVIVDQTALGLYWFKYAKHKAVRFEQYSDVKNTQELTFVEWLNMYAGLDNKESIPEHALELGFTQTIPQK